MYESHGDYFDEYDDLAAAKAGYTSPRTPDTTWCDPVAQRDDHIRAAHEFNATVARMEYGRLLACEEVCT